MLHGTDVSEEFSLDCEPMSAESMTPPHTVFVPREIKAQESRVGLSVTAAAELVHAGVAVFLQAGAGEGSGFADADYEKVGVTLLRSAEEGFSSCDLIVKVKEPQPREFSLLRPGQLLFTYLHLAAEPEVTAALLERGVTALAYETLSDDAGQLPLLRPMSEVAGRLSVQEGARHLLRPQGGRGVLLGGVTGTPRGRVCIIGGGVVGTEAAKMAAGLGADVVVLDKSLERLRELSEILPSNVLPLFSHRRALLEQLEQADLVVGAVLLRGAKAPRLISRADLSRMKPGSVIVDVAIDQGGICETSRTTSHAEPTYVVDGVVHYCVPNMPGAVSRTSTEALSNATLPYVGLLARLGLAGAIAERPELRGALNTISGKLTEPEVAQALGLAFTRASELV